MILDLTLATWVMVNVSVNGVPLFGIPEFVTVMLTGACALSSIKSSGVSLFVGCQSICPSIVSGPRPITYGVCVPATIQYTCRPRFTEREKFPMPAYVFVEEIVLPAM